MHIRDGSDRVLSSIVLTSAAALHRGLAERALRIAKLRNAAMSGDRSALFVS
jgi:hypothetical protein